MPGVLFLPNLSEAELLAAFLWRHPEWFLRSLALHGAYNARRYSAIWVHKPDHPPQDLAVDVDSLEIEQLIVLQRERGYVPTILTATSLGKHGNTARRFAVVFEKPRRLPPEPIVVLGMEFGTFIGELYQANKAGENGEPDTKNLWDPRVIVSFDAYPWGEDGETSLAILAYPQPKAPRVRIAYSVTGDRADEMYSGNAGAWNEIPETAATRRGWGRAEHVVPSPFASGDWRTLPLSKQLAPDTRLLFTLWRGDTFVPWPADLGDRSFTGGVVVRGPLHLKELNAEVANMLAAGLSPWTVGAKGVGWNTRYCVTFVPSEACCPLPRTLIVVDARQDPTQLRVPPKAHHCEVGLECLGLVPLETVIVRPGRIKDNPFGPKSPSDPNPGPFPFSNHPERAPRPRRRTSGLPSVDMVGMLSVPHEAPDAEWVTYHSDPSPPENEAVDAAPNPATYHLFRYAPIDAAVLKNMRTTGARAAQVAIVSDNLLVCWRAYTFAEANYPVTRVTDLMRIGSVSKALTGMVIVDLFAGDDSGSGLDISLADAFEIPLASIVNSSNKTDFVAPGGLERMLRHTSGWPADVNEAKVAFYARGEALPAMPGDTHRFMQKTPSRIVANTIGDELYSGATLRALGELASHRLSDGGFWTDYEPEMVKWWRLHPNDVEASTRAQAIQRTPEGSLARHHAPAHAYRPRSGQPYDPDGFQLLLPVAYSENNQWTLAAGHWCMSAGTLARIFAGMLPGANVPQLMTSPARVRLLVGRAQGESGSYGRLFVSRVLKSILPIPGTNSHVTESHLLHNGAISGGLCVARLKFEGATPTETGANVAVVLLVNQDIGAGGIGEGAIDPIESAAAQVAAKPGWEDGDLFDAL